jgi:hypothetical protein
MCKFSIPLHDRGDKRFFTFRVEPKRLLFAGSRHLRVEPRVCKGLVDQFGKLGFTFLTGCASGVDESFRVAFSESEYREHSMVACAFKDRAERLKRSLLSLCCTLGTAPQSCTCKAYIVDDFTLYHVDIIPIRSDRQRLSISL